MSSLIIESPHRQGMVRKFVQGGLTLFFWGLWIYLMLPLAAPLMALVGLKFSLFASATHTEHIWFIFPIMLFSAMAMLGMQLWVIYNIFLHHRRNQQARLSSVCQNELASHFGVAADDLADWHSSGQMTIRLTEQGDVHDVEVNQPFAASIQPGNRRTVRSQKKAKVRHLKRTELSQCGIIPVGNRVIAVLDGASP